MTDASALAYMRALERTVYARDAELRQLRQVLKLLADTAPSTWRDELRGLAESRGDLKLKALDRGGE